MNELLYLKHSVQYLGLATVQQKLVHLLLCKWGLALPLCMPPNDWCNTLLTKQTKGSTSPFAVLYLPLSTIFTAGSFLDNLWKVMNLSLIKMYICLCQKKFMYDFRVLIDILKSIRGSWAKKLWWMHSTSGLNSHKILPIYFKRYWGN